MVQEKSDITPVEVPAALRRPVAQAKESNLYHPLNDISSSFEGETKSDLSYEIKGETSKFLEVKLRPGQSVIGEINSLMYYEAGINMKMRLGAPTNLKQSFFSKLLGMGKAALTGHSLFMMYFTNTSQKDLIIAFSMPYTGNVVPIDLSSIGNKIICQDESFLCASADLQFRPATPKDLGGNFITSAIPMQIIEGRGTLFLFCGGSLVKQNITNSSPIHVTTGTTLALQPGISLRIKRIPNVGITGEGLMLTEISGLGQAWIQSLPYKRAKDNMIAQIGMFFGIAPKKKNPVWGK